MTTVKQPKLVVAIINYNSGDCLKSCVKSVLEQSYENKELIFIDNNSPEKDALDYMHATFDKDPLITIIANTENRGYARAANQAIKMAIGRGAEYVIIANPDVIFGPDYFEKSIKKMEKEPGVAALTGKIYKYDFLHDKPTDIIDTVGLFAYKNRRVIDDGQGVVDKGQFDKEVEVFGVSGACPLYRVAALEDVKIFGEYFDEDFFMYKEDIDLSWRFLLYGWKNLYYPEVVGYHGRGTGVYPRFTTKELAKLRKTIGKTTKKLSFRNQHLMTTKNEMWGNFFQDFFPIMGRKLAVPFYVLFMEPYLIPSYLQYVKLMPKMIKKRKVIMKNKKTSAKEMKKYFGKQSRYFQAKPQA